MKRVIDNNITKCELIFGIYITCIMKLKLFEIIKDKAYFKYNYINSDWQ